MPHAQPTGAPPLISLRSVALAYGGREILREIELDISAGEFWCFLGPNGEGKTTLVKALLGALRPRRGQLQRQDEMFRAGKVSYVRSGSSSAPRSR